MDELVAAQQQLGRSLGKARAGEDKELSQRLRDSGEALAQMLSGSLKMSRIHAADNKAFDSPVAEIVRSLKTLDELVGVVHLVTVDESAYLNDIRLRAEGKPGLRELGGELRKHNVGGITFHAPLDSTQVRALVRALSSSPHASTPRTAVRTALEASGVRTIELHGIYRFRTSSEKARTGSAHALGAETSSGAPTSRLSGIQPGGGSSSRPSGVLAEPGLAHTAAPLSDELETDAADASFESTGVTHSSPSAIAHRGAEAAPETAVNNPAFGMLDELARLSRAAWAALGTGRTFSPLSLRRGVAEVLEIGADSTALWDAWVTGPTKTNHAVSVAVHALLVGQTLGLSVAALQDLGVASLVHDIGYAALRGTPAEHGAEGLLRHPGAGARLLLQQRGFSVSKLRRLRAVFDHHRGWSDADKPSALGGILHLVEDYLGFLRVAGTQTTAVHVLGAMAQDPGSLYQPALLHCFINALGQFPPGVLLGLDDGRTVRSVSPVRSPELFESPLVREVDLATGRAIGPQRSLGDAKVTAMYPG